MKANKLAILALTLVTAFSMTACAPKQEAAPAPAPAPTEAAKAPVKLDPEMEAYYVTADWLKANKDSVVLVDATPDKGYKVAHIQGAVNITWQMLSNMKPKQGEPGWGVVLGKDELAAKIGGFGIDGTKTVVVYNDPKGLGEEGRVHWMLKIAGIKDVKMLYGGSPAWKAVGGEMTAEVPSVTPAKFAIEKYDDSLIATTEYVKSNLGKVKLIDTRSPEEFKGETNHGENYKGEKALGRIPGAIHLHYQDLYNVDGTPKSAAEMKKIFEGLGLKPEDEIVTYCTVGIRSGFTAEMMRMVGFSKAKNYNASFSEWAGQGLEIEK